MFHRDTLNDLREFILDGMLQYFLCDKQIHYVKFSPYLVHFEFWFTKSYQKSAKFDKIG